MVGFFNTARARKAIRRQARYKHMFSYDSNTNTTVELNRKQIEAQQLGFTGYSLKYGDVMVTGNIEDMIPNYQYDIDPDNHNLVTNGVFEGVRCDKVGLIYAPKLKKFIYLALNDDYTCFILFQSDNIHTLPNTENIDMDNLNVRLDILENANRMLSSVYQYVHDLTNNPILLYKVNEVFKK